MDPAVENFCIYCRLVVPHSAFMDHMADKHPPKRKPDPPLYHDDKTLFKVAQALLKAGCTNTQATDAINEMLNAGILFREHAIEETSLGDDQEGAR